jgi:hypothetical protein
MPMQDARAEEYEIAKYICPKSKTTVPLVASRPLAFIHWPVVVKNCARCGTDHVLELADVQHPPVYGYE